MATNASHIYTAGVSRKFFPPKKTMLTVHLRAPTLTNQHKESAQTNQDKESTLTNPDKEITRNQQKQPWGITERKTKLTNQDNNSNKKENKTDQSRQQQQQKGKQNWPIRITTNKKEKTLTNPDNNEKEHKTDQSGQQQKARPLINSRNGQGYRMISSSRKQHSSPQGNIRHRRETSVTEYNMNHC